jgi:hypothetical protein
MADATFARRIARRLARVRRGTAMPHARCVRPAVARGLTRFGTRTPRARLVAWLGLLAIWLAVVAPVVTQLLASPWFASPAAQVDLRAQLSAALCSAHDAFSPIAARASHSPAAPSHDDHHAKACGYCNLLAHSPPVGGASFVAALPRLASHRVPVHLARHVLFSPRFAFATPRGPPLTVA